MLISTLPIVSLVIWVIILVLPWQPWRTKESWESTDDKSNLVDLSDVTVLIPARNESEVIGQTISAVCRQGKNLNILVIDDNSDDDTARIAKEIGGDHLTIIKGSRRPQGWSGKLWALEQGRKRVKTSFVMLLDADIKLKQGVISGLRERLKSEPYAFISLMAMPTFTGFWDKLLMPAFIYFFKLLYPFRVSNSDSDLVAAAAGGCILTKKQVLDDIGGFASLKDTLIDDCTLARQVKDQGYRTWLGLTHSAQSIRPYTGLTELWNMVARTAYTQLSYSITLLLLCTLLMFFSYVLPIVGVFLFSGYLLWASLVTVLIMLCTYLPTLWYYNLNWSWAIAFPLTASLFLAMTWTSAIRYWQGERMRWRGRVVKNEI